VNDTSDNDLPAEAIAASFDVEIWEERDHAQRVGIELFRKKQSDINVRK